MVVLFYKIKMVHKQRRKFDKNTDKNKQKPLLLFFK